LLKLPRQGATLSLLEAAWSPVVPTPPVVFGFARNAATFDVFYWLQVTNYGLLYVFDLAAPSGSDYIDVWDLCLLCQMASPIFPATVLATVGGGEAEKLFDSESPACWCASIRCHLPIVNANQRDVSAAKLCLAIAVLTPQFAVRYL
jgi:hypothetical protein